MEVYKSETDSCDNKIENAVNQLLTNKSMEKKEDILVSVDFSNLVQELSKYFSIGDTNGMITILKTIQDFINMDYTRNTDEKSENELNQILYSMFDPNYDKIILPYATCLLHNWAQINECIIFHSHEIFDIFLTYSTSTDLLQEFDELIDYQIIFFQILSLFIEDSSEAAQVFNDVDGINRVCDVYLNDERDLYRNTIIVLLTNLFKSVPKKSLIYGISFDVFELLSNRFDSCFENTTKIDFKFLDAFIKIDSTNASFFLKKFNLNLHLQNLINKLQQKNYNYAEYILITFKHAIKGASLDDVKESLQQVNWDMFMDFFEFSNSKVHTKYFSFIRTIVDKNCSEAGLPICYCDYIVDDIISSLNEKTFGERNKALQVVQSMLCRNFGCFGRKLIENEVIQSLIICLECDWSDLIVMSLKILVSCLNFGSQCKNYQELILNKLEESDAKEIIDNYIVDPNVNEEIINQCEEFSHMYDELTKIVFEDIEWKPKKWKNKTENLIEWENESESDSYYDED